MKRLIVGGAASLLVTLIGCNATQERPVSLVERSNETANGAPAAVAPQSTDAKPAILEDEMRNDLYFLASDRLEGRGVGTAGLDIASDFVAARFASLGLKPLPQLGGYFQPFDMTWADNIDPATSLAIADGEPLKLKDDYTAASFSADKSFDAPIVFAGYGITDTERKYDDYAGLDVKGKAVLVMRYEPHDAKGKSAWTHADWSPNSSLENKARAAAEHGAVALLMVNPPNYHDGQTPLANPKDQGKGDGDPFVAFAHRYAGTVPIPFLHVKRTVADDILKRGGAKGTLKDLQAEIDKSAKPAAVALKDVKAAGNVLIKRTKRSVRNVVATIPGAGPHADEFVIVGAHYDHLGYGGPGSGSLANTSQLAKIAEALNPHAPPATAPATQLASTKPTTRPTTNASRALHYGADDNGSGTVTMLELARIYAHRARTSPPDRTMIFCAFTAEESGLVGSARFANHPPIDLKKVAAMLNLDMVGRVRNNLLYIGGGGTAAPFKEFLKQADAASPLEFKNMGDGGMGPSDHMSFALKKVPVIFLFSGNHADYHRPTDTPDKINYDGMADVARLSVTLVDDFQKMPLSKYVDAADKTSMMNPLATGDTSAVRKASLGVIPEYGNDEDGKGVKIGGTTAGTAAEKAGLQAGDVVLQLGEKPTGTLMELSAVLAAHQPGDKVKLVYQRGDKKVTTEVTLTARSGG
jgi:Zn-dependent M28 family amino/carboxypeptidase